MADPEYVFDLKRVVVLDDEPAMLRTHRRVLRTHGFRPVPITDPYVALDEVLERVPGVLIVDLLMPGMTGLELVTQLRTELGRACPPVILVSGNLADLAPMEQIMFDALFSKPYSVDAFIECVTRLARRHKDRVNASSATLTKRGVIDAEREESS